MSYKLEVFEWVADYIREQIPEYASLEELKSLAHEASARIESIKDGLEVNKEREEIAETIGNKKELISLKESTRRMKTALKVHKIIYSIYVYNIKQIKNIEKTEDDSSYANRLKTVDLENVLRLEKEILRLNNRMKELERMAHGTKNKLDKNVLQMTLNYEYFDDFLGYTSRALFFLLDNSSLPKSHEEYQRVMKVLSAVPDIIQKVNNWGLRFTHSKGDYFKERRRYFESKREKKNQDENELEPDLDQEGD